MEAADHHLNAGFAQRPRDIHRAREFVGLHADNADEPEPAILGDAAHELLRHDARIGLVDGDDVDRKIGAKHLAFRRAVGQAEHGGKRVRRHGRAQPLHDIAVSVVMRRLDQDQLKAPCRRRAFGAEHPSVPGRRWLAKGSSNGPRKPFASEWTLTGFRVLDPREYCRMTGNALSAPATTNSKGLKHILDGGSNGIGRQRGKVLLLLPRLRAEFRRFRGPDRTRQYPLPGNNSAWCGWRRSRRAW